MPKRYVEKGIATESRRQWVVHVAGKISDYETKGADFSCDCMLAPEIPQDGAGKRKLKSFCRTDCRVQIHYRQYQDCTRREVLEYLIDFEEMHTIPKEVLEESPKRKIKESEYSTRTNVVTSH